MISRLRLSLLIMCLCALLCGCAAYTPAATASPEPSTPVVTARPSPTPSPLPDFEFMGRLYPADSASVDLTGITDDAVPAAAEALARMPYLESIALGDENSSPLSWDSISLLHQAAPGAG